MFLAVRELKFATGRFALITTVVTLMTLLVGFLAGLTGGLASANTSALSSLGANHVVLSIPDGQSTSLGNSSITSAQAQAWSRVDTVRPLGIMTGGLSTGDHEKAVTLMGTSGDNRIPRDTQITLSASTAETLKVQAGDTINVAGSDMQVDKIVEDAQYSHMDVAWLSMNTWHEIATRTGATNAYATALIVTDGSAQIDGTTVVSGFNVFLAIDAFRSEIGSLAMIIGMLVVISTLVIGVFFLVWSMQRRRDIAVLKAMGAATSWLVKDTLVQACIILAIGTVVGTGLTWVAGISLGGVMPFVLSPLLLFGPPVAMFLSGLIGSLISLKQIVSVDPNQALATASA